MRIFLCFLTLMFGTAAFAQINDMSDSTSLYMSELKSIHGMSLASNSIQKKTFRQENVTQEEVIYLNKDLVPNELKKEKSFFSGELIYFIGTAALAAVVYFLWPEDNETVDKKLTFGTPPLPK